MKKCMFLWLWFLVVVSGWGSLCFAQRSDRIAAIVNDAVITEAELALFASMTDLGDFTETDALEMRKRLLQRMVEDSLILQEAKKMKLNVNERLVEERIEEIEEKAGSAETFEQALEQQGITLNELRDKMRNQLLVYLAIQHVITDRIRVNPKEVTDYYDQHPDEFMIPQTAVVDSIFTESKDALDKVREGLEQGNDFQKIAKAYSQKGNLGTIKRGQLKKELDDFIFSLEPGRYSKPFQSQDGYYIFLVKEKKQASCEPIEEVKGKIATMLQKAKTERKLKEWIEELKEKAYISIRE